MYRDAQSIDMFSSHNFQDKEIQVEKYREAKSRTSKHFNLQAVKVWKNQKPSAFTRQWGASDFKKFATELSHVEHYSWASGRNLACGTLKKKVLDGSGQLVLSSAFYATVWVGKAESQQRLLTNVVHCNTPCNANNML